MNKNILYALVLVLPALALLASCGAHVEPRVERKEPTEAQKEAVQKIQQQVRSTITDPIYDVAVAACRYKKEYGLWPSVEFSTTPESPFESFTSTTQNNGAYETTFQLKALPSSLMMIVSLDEKGNATPSCRVSLLPQNDTKKRSQFEDPFRLKGKSRPVANNFSFHKDRILLDTTEDRDAFASPFVAIAILKNVLSNAPTYRPTAKEQLTAKGMEAILKAAMCVALRVSPSQCK